MIPVFPMFLFTLWIFAVIYKHDMVGGFIETDENYKKAARYYEEKWKQKDLIREDKLKKEKLIEQIYKVKKEKQ